MFKSSMFPNSLKLAGLTLLHKKGRKELNEDYRSVSILPTFSKTFKRIKFAQISRFFDNVFSKHQGKAIGLNIAKKWKNVLAKEKFLVLY